MKTTIMAIRSQNRPKSGQVIFGQFKCLDINDAECTMGFTADRYAYVGSPLALSVWSNDDEKRPMWEPYISLTVNVRPNDCLGDEIIVKTYSENAHMRAPLLKTGFFEDTGKRIATGYVDLEVWRISEKFEEAFDAVYPQLEPA